MRSGLQGVELDRRATLGGDGLDEGVASDEAVAVDGREQPRTALHRIGSTQQREQRVLFDLEAACALAAVETPRHARRGLGDLADRAEGDDVLAVALVGELVEAPRRPHRAAEVVERDQPARRRGLAMGREQRLEGGPDVHHSCRSLGFAPLRAIAQRRNWLVMSTWSSWAPLGKLVISAS